jgi:hypothetical protein
LDPLTFGTIAMGVGDISKMFAGLMDNTGHNTAMLEYRKANLMQSALEENMRRAEGREAQVMSSTKSRMAGSGLEFDSGSFVDYLNGLATEFQKQNAFEKKQAEGEIALTRGAAYVQDSNPVTKLKTLMDQSGKSGVSPQEALGVFGG